MNVKCLYLEPTLAEGKQKNSRKRRHGVANIDQDWWGCEKSQTVEGGLFCPLTDLSFGSANDFESFATAFAWRKRSLVLLALWISVENWFAVPDELVNEWKEVLQNQTFCHKCRSVTLSFWNLHSLNFKCCLCLLLYCLILFS